MSKRKYRNYTDEDIINYAKEVKSIAGLLTKLGIAPRGGNYGNIKKTLQRLNVDTSHWTGQGWNKGVMCKNWGQYRRGGSLKPHLIILRGHKCENCNNTEWMGVKIPLELEHCDGDNTNNKMSNLKLLCCNCHALTPTWRKRKDSITDPISDILETETHQREEEVIREIIIQKNKNSTIQENLKPLIEKLPRKKRNKYATLDEARQAITKGCYPTNDELLEKVWNTSLLQLAKEIGVSSSGLKHYCQKRNIPTPPPGYWRKFTTGRIEEYQQIKDELFNGWEGIARVTHFNIKNE